MRGLKYRYLYLYTNIALPILQYASGEVPHINKQIIFIQMEFKLNLDNQTTEQLEKKYFELLEIQYQLKEYQTQLESVLFLPF